MRPVSLLLKGFKGIKAGMGLDEVAIDFTDMPEGVVAFSAPNGTGKTTIMDCLHPYRIMPFRTGSYSPKAFSFYDHTYGEAAKELVFAMNGTRYKSLILIIPDKKKQEAYLHKEENGVWVAMNDGKTESYDNAVEDILGNPELFFMSVFRAQNAKSLTAYSKGDIKEIFTELLGIDHLKILSERAGAIKIEKQRLLADLRAEKSVLVEAAEAKDSIEAELASITETRNVAKAEADALELSIKQGQEKLTTIEVKLAERNASLSRRREMEVEIGKKREALSNYLSEQKKKTSETEARITRVKDKVIAAEELISKLPKLRVAEEEKTTLEHGIESQRSQLDGLDAEYQKLGVRHENLMKAEGLMKDKEKILQKLRMERESSREIASRSLDVARREKEKLNGTPCGGELAEGCVFVKSAVSEANRIPELESRLAGLEIESAEEVKTAEDIANIKMIVFGNNELGKKMQTLLEEKKEVQEKIREYDRKVSALSKTLLDLPKVSLAETELPALRDELNLLEAELKEVKEKTNQQNIAYEAEISNLNEKLAELGNGLSQDFESEKKNVVAEIEKAKRDINILNAKIEEATAKTGAMTAELRRAEDASGKLDSIAAKENALAGETSQWATLEKALGNDGIIALEISDAGPQITAYANELLKIIGGRFSVKIETQFIKAKGGTKEGFDIIVYDGRTNEAKSLKLLSGGEKTWVEEAITRAICLYRANTSGIRYECLFSDEKDGALDSEKKKEFFDMKQRVLELGGYKNEFCITQTDSLLLRADAVIELKKEHGITVTKN